MPNIQLNEAEHGLLTLFMKMPPEYEEAITYIQKANMSAESVTKVGIQYVENCFGDFGNSVFNNMKMQVALNKIERPQGVVSGLHSAYIYDIIKLLLEYGLDPNAIVKDDCYRYNIMDELQYIDNEYVAADTMALLLEHGGDPNLIIDGESVFENIDFEIWFGAIEQSIRWRYDSWVRVWMVMVAYGGKVSGKCPIGNVFKEYESCEMFDLRKLRNHRDYFFGLSIENEERTLHIYDKKTFWKVAEA